MVDDQGYGYHVVPVTNGCKVATLAIELSAFDTDNVRFFMGAFGDQRELVQAYDLSERQGDLISNSIEEIDCSTDIMGNRTFMWSIPRFAFHAVIGEMENATLSCEKSILQPERINGFLVGHASNQMVMQRRLQSVMRIVGLVRICLDNEIKTARSMAEQNRLFRDEKFRAKIAEDIAAGAKAWLENKQEM